MAKLNQIITANRLRRAQEDWDAYSRDSSPYFLGSGVQGVRFVNCTARNTIDQNSPNTVFADSGGAGYDGDAQGTSPRVCLLHFESAVGSIKSVFLQFATVPIARWDVPDQSGWTLATASLGMGAMTTDWDPATVTWNNFASGRSPSAFGRLETAGSWKNNTGGTITGTMQHTNFGSVAGVATPMQSIGFEALESGPYFGLAVNIGIPAITGSTTDRTSDLVIQISDPLVNAASSFIIA